MNGSFRRASVLLLLAACLPAGRTLAAKVEDPEANPPQPAAAAPTATPAAAELAATPAAAATSVPGAPNISPEAAQTIEQIMKDREALITGKRFTYDPGGRRDPFRSLIEEVRRNKAQRPKGVRGMMIAEVDLVGLVHKSGGDIAFFNGSDNKGYFLKVGDELFDGRLIAIDSRTGTVTFRQQVDDPRQIKPYREIIKRLVPLEQEDVNETGG